MDMPTKVSHHIVHLPDHQHLHPLVEFESSFVDQRLNEDYHLDTFEQIANTNELAKKDLVNMKLFIFK